MVTSVSPLRVYFYDEGKAALLNGDGMRFVLHACKLNSILQHSIAIYFELL